VRDHGDLARIEVPLAEVPRAAELRDAIGAELRGLGYRYVTLDLAGFRSGSLNDVLLQPSLRRD
jgi:pyridinium-3,5-biscarboxylic acid mononucleotide sulfurtransferase